MKSLKVAFLATAAAFGLAAAAQAADPILPAPFVPTPAPALGHDWSGFYAGVNAGYGWGRGTSGASGFNRVDGVFGGAQIGWNHQFDAFVLGVEADIQAANQHQTIGGTRFSLDYFGTVRARAGVAFDNFLPYVTGGFAYGGLAAEAPGFARRHEVHTGWTLGAGVEFAATDQISVKAEYLYIDLENRNYFTGAQTINAGLHAHTARIGVNFSF